MQRDNVHEIIGADFRGLHRDDAPSPLLILTLGIVLGWTFGFLTIALVWRIVSG